MNHGTSTIIFFGNYYFCDFSSSSFRRLLSLKIVQLRRNQTLKLFLSLLQLFQLGAYVQQI